MLSHVLNEQQQRAVSHTEGPLLITAGPGSGKTFVLAQKVKRLVDSGVKESEILSMTFTEKAAGEMQQRLERFGILDSQVSTFHSFSMELLKDNFESGLGKNTKIFKETSQLVWYIQNTDRFGLDQNHLNVGNNQVRIYKDVLNAIGILKVERIDPKKLQEYIDSQGLLPAGTVQTDIDVMTQQKNLRLLNELNKIYSAYQKYLRANDLVDFGDMISETIRLLENDPVILQSYLDKYRYVLVDEFQDNNYSQLTLVKLLGKHGNVTVVGDEDQCIMRFQGAFSGIFDEFQLSYPNLETVELTRNYRSTKNIIDLASQLLAASGGGKRRSFSEEEDGEPVMVVRTATDAGQEAYVVDNIRSLVGRPLARRGGGTEPISYRDIAILSRRKTEGQMFVRALRSSGIPTTFVGEMNIFESPIILDMMSFLRIANSQMSCGASVYRLLKRHGISEQNIAILTKEAHKKARYLYEGEQDYVLETIRRYDQFSITQKSEIAEFLEQIDVVIRTASYATTSELVYKIMFDISGLYKKAIGLESDKKDALLLNKFYEISQEYQDLNPGKPLSDFLKHLSIIENFEIEIEDPASEDAVNVLTMHKSKGKEFPIVFVTNLVDGKFPSNLQKPPFVIPEELMQGRRNAYSEQLHIEEERRLFYVAMTRAMNLLFLLHPKKYTNNVREKRPSRFLEELNFENNSLIKVIDFTEPGSPDMALEHIVNRTTSDLQREASNAVNQLHLKTAVHRIVELYRMQHYDKHGTLEGFDPSEILKIDLDDLNFSDFTGKKRHLINRDSFTLSPSSIKTYEECPLKFKFQKIIRVPQSANVAMDLGGVIHTVIEELSKEKIAGKRITREHAMEKLREKWVFRSYLNQTDEDVALKRAETMIYAYLGWEDSTQNTLVDTEVQFKVRIGEVIFAGRIDRLEQNDRGEFELIDFKTGSTAKTKNKARTDIQLNIYARAIQKIKGRLPVRASLFYVEQDKIISYDVTPESVEEALLPVEKMTAEILKENFEATPDYWKCQHCSYASICDSKIP